MDAKPANNQPWANPQIRVAAVIVALIAVGVVLWLVLGHSSKKGHGTNGGKTYKMIGPEFKSAAGLRSEALALGIPFYWAGPQPGFKYEFTRKTSGDLFVRYLPIGTPAGRKGAKWTVVVTYPVIGGYLALKQQAKKVGARTLKGAHGSIIYVDQSDPRSVYLGFKSNAAYQVVVFSPRPTVAANIATSGKVRPVTG